MSRGRQPLRWAKLIFLPIAKFFGQMQQPKMKKVMYLTENGIYSIQRGKVAEI